MNMGKIAAALRNAQDPCGWVFLLVILGFLGHRLVEAHAQLRSWGWRIGGAVFAVAGAVLLLDTDPREPAGLLDVVLRSLACGGLAASVSWVTLPMIAFVTDGFLLAPLRVVRRWNWALERRQAKRQRQREEQVEAARRQQALAEQERLRQLNAPFEEAKRLLAAHEQCRRDDARAACESLYNVHAPEIAGRFPRAQFEDFMKRHLGDHHTAEHVEARAAQLQAIIEQHRQKIDPPKRHMSLAELAQWFSREKSQVNATPLDDEDKQALLAQLEARYAKIQEKLIRGLEP